MKHKICKVKKHGSALIIVMIAVMLILSLGSVALAVSLNNMKMSGKVATSNAEYYHLEKAAQESLIEIDKELIKAEKYALDYMQKELYKKTYPYVQYEESVINMKSSGNIENKSDNHDLIHAIWQEEVYKKSLMQDGVTVNSVLYTEYLDDFFKQAFNRLYYSYTQRLYKDGHLKITAGTLANSELATNSKYYEAYFSAEFVRNEQKDYDNFKIVPVNDSTLSPEKLAIKQVISNKEQWAKFELTPTDFVVNLQVYGCNVQNGAKELASNNFTLGGKELQGRKIIGNLAIMPPVYEGVDSEKYRTVRANPAYTNAITASGGIDINGGKQTINGEVVSTKGDINLNSSDTTVNGNLCSGENLNLNSTAKLDVAIFPASNGEVKLSVFNKSDLFYNINEEDIVTMAISRPKIGEVMEESAHIYTSSKGKVCMPFIFKDSKGGSVYTKTLNLNNGTSETEFTTRNLMFSDKVNMKDCDESKFTVSNVMLSSEDYSYMSVNNYTVNNYTSTNNHGNTTNINGGYVGKTFINPGNAYDEPFVKQQLNQYRLSADYNRNEKYCLRGILNARTKHLGTLNRGVSDLVNKGLLVNTIKNTENPEGIPLFHLSDVGKWSDTSIVKYLAPKKDETSVTLDLAGKDFNGIIYCSGDLILQNSGGAGSVNGSIICDGKVTINGDIKIEYSENIVKNTITSTKISERFFAPGEMGSSYSVAADGTGGNVTEKVVNNTARTRTGKDRYIVTKWARSRVR